MKVISLILLIFLSCVVLNAQDKKIIFDDRTVIDLSESQDEDPDCGESDSFTIRRGKAIKIINGNSFIFAVDNEFEKETYKVILAGIDISSNSSELKKLLKKMLIENLLNRNIMIVGNESKSGNKKIFGIVYPIDENKIFTPNRYFLKSGLAKYIEPPRKTVPNYTLCEYRKFAKQAKEAKLGIWAK